MLAQEQQKSAELQRVALEEINNHKHTRQQLANLENQRHAEHHKYQNLLRQSSEERDKLLGETI